LDETENASFIWTPIKLTDKATGRSVHITIFERELYLSGFFTFEDFWEGEYSSMEQGKSDAEQDNQGFS
jgi:hypothetical protein